MPPTTLERIAPAVGITLAVILFLAIFGLIFAYLGLIVWGIVAMVGAIASGNWMLAWFLLAVFAVLAIARR